MLTLFALVLAIGIVVDNAIVVVEAVHVKMHNEKLPPAKATEAAIREIGGAIIAITLVMSAVFCTGRLYVWYGRYFLPAVLVDAGGGDCYFGCECLDAVSCALCLDAEACLA